MKFVTLHNEHGNAILVNMATVTHITANPQFCELQFVDGRFLTIKETFEQLDKLLSVKTDKNNKGA